ncbi:hypothetical protein [Geothrix fuzhouensis]|uniref:hypothetical protein n=1 Tax=Geothrix fuzhouensis TaxID=2966451 RepID=UPI002147AE14|nr:hypothetical protein [Geothrix fuzhouensis]
MRPSVALASLLPIGLFMAVALQAAPPTAKAPAQTPAKAIGPKPDDPRGKNVKAIGPKPDDPRGKDVKAIGPKPDDPRGKAAKPAAAPAPAKR